MGLPGFGFGFRRRRRASAGVVLLMLIPLLGIDVIRDTLQTREAYSGTIERIYAERSLLSGRRNNFNHYWDIRGTDGELHTLRIRSKAAWGAAHRGQWINKRAGELYP